VLILGLDLALSCGWCLLREDVVEQCGVHKIKAKDEGRVAEVKWLRECRRYEDWSAWLVALRESGLIEGLGAIVYESPNLATMRSLAHAESYGALRGVLQLELGDVAPTHRLMPSQVKKRAAGNGRASKEEVREAVNAKFDLGLRADDHDTSDAVAIAWAYQQGLS